MIDRNALLAWARERVQRDRTIAPAFKIWQRLVDEVSSGRFDVQPNRDRLLADLERAAGADRVDDLLELAIEAAKAHLIVEDLTRPVEIDLNDPATENLVADAIARLAPEGTFVPLTVRYPWRFGRFADLTTPQRAGEIILDAVHGALRASAAVHEAAGLRDMVAPLLALAEALEHGALVPGPPPGPCPSRRELTTLVDDGDADVVEVTTTLICSLRALHAGLHEAPYADGTVTWSDEQPGPTS